jgi:hypothetical protein
MKYLLTLFISFIAFNLKAQTLTYYHYENNANWDCITYFNNQVNPVTVIYNSSKFTVPVTISYVSNQVKDGVNISVVHLGNDPTNYVLIQNKKLT